MASDFNSLVPLMDQSAELFAAQIDRIRNLKAGAYRAKVAPRAFYENHVELTVPEEIEQCGGIALLGKLVKSLVFSTDVAIIRNCDADAVLAVYPFTCQPEINQALIIASGRPVLNGVAGGITKGERSVSMAKQSQFQGAFGVVANMMTPAEDIEALAASVDIPVVLTVSVLDDSTRARIGAGVGIVNVAAGKKTPRVVAAIRAEYPDMPIIASGGPTAETVSRTIAAGADAITWTPPNIQEIERQVMLGHRIRANA